MSVAGTVGENCGVRGARTGRSGPERARAFYGRLLGIPERPKPEPLAGRGGCWFEAGGLRIHLGVEDPFVPARKAHPARRRRAVEHVGDRDVVAAHVLDRAVADGLVRAFVDDPFGNRIELVQHA